MKARFALAALAAAFVSTVAAAQMSPGMAEGHGPGMMGGQGPGMMGGQGPGMMGGQGPGMMGGHRMGHGMMGGHGFKALEALNLSEEQRGKVKDIQRDLQRKNHALMGSLREIRWKGQDLAKGAELDLAAARKLYDEGAAVHKQMFEARLEARAKTEAVLTKEQREQLRKARAPRPA